MKILLNFIFRNDAKVKGFQATANLVTSTPKDFQQSEEDIQLQSYYKLCKSFVHQLGFLSWEKRQSFNLLKKSPQLLRELKSLDDQTWSVLTIIIF